MGPNVGLRYFRQMETCYNWHMIVKGKSPDAGRAAISFGANDEHENVQEMCP